MRRVSSSNWMRCAHSIGRHPGGRSRSTSVPGSERRHDLKRQSLVTSVRQTLFRDCHRQATKTRKREVYEGFRAFVATSPDGTGSADTRLTAPFEELNRSFVLFRRSPRLEGSEIPLSVRTRI